MSRKRAVSPETEMWTRPNASSGEFAALKARGVVFPRQPGLFLSALYRLLDWRDRRSSR